MAEALPVISVIGGTGSLGSALSRYWVKAGLSVIIGSRDAEKAQETAAHLALLAKGEAPRGMTNVEAARAGGIVVLTVPFSIQAAMLNEVRDAVAGKIVVDTTVPLVPPKIARVQLPVDGSAAVSAQKRLGESVRVVSAFHNVAAHKLARDESVDCDVLVFGDDQAARESVIELARLAGLRGIHGGPLANSAAAEAMTSVLISINRRYGVDGAGLRISGLREG